MNQALRELPSQETLLSLLSYDRETGALVWKVRGDPRWDKRYAGTMAGAVFTQASGRQYLVVGILGRTYYAHRIAWKMVTGQEPPVLLDHADNDGLNNRWANLREASAKENAANSKVRSDNATGVKGVRRSGARTERYCARISVNSEMVHLGSFATKEEAAAVRNEAAQRLYGEFARVA